MKKFNKKVLVSLAILFVFGFFGSIKMFAYTTPATVNLGTAGNYIILSKTAISTTGATSITGDIGVSPIGHTAMTGFSETLDGTGDFSTSTYVNTPGKLYASDYAHATPATMSTAISDMETAYNDAAGRTANSTGLGAGNIGGMTLAPGVYKWSTGVTIPTNLTLSGTASDVWIFEIAGNLSIASAKSVILTGGALPENIFWAVAGTTTLNTTSNFSGTILAGPATSTIAMKSGAVLNGRALGQKDVTLIANTITTITEDNNATTATLHVIKKVINNDHGNKDASDFRLSVKNSSDTDVSNSPADGAVDPGTSYTLDAGTYTVSEVEDSSYTQSFSGDCDENGSVTLVAGFDYTCTITNNDVHTSSGGSHVIGSVPSSGGTTYIPTAVVTPTPVVIPAVITTVVPKLPKTGFAPKEENTSWYQIISSTIINWFK